MGPAAEYEAELLVEKRWQVAREIQKTADLIQQFPLIAFEFICHHIWINT